MGNDTGLNETLPLSTRVMLNLSLPNVGSCGSSAGSMSIKASTTPSHSSKGRISVPCLSPDGRGRHTIHAYKLWNPTPLPSTVNGLRTGDATQAGKVSVPSWHLLYECWKRYSVSSVRSQDGSTTYILGFFPTVEKESLPERKSHREKQSQRRETKTQNPWIQPCLKPLTLGILNYRIQYIFPFA